MSNRFRILFLQGALVPSDTYVAVIGLFSPAALSLDFARAAAARIQAARLPPGSNDAPTANRSPLPVPAQGLKELARLRGDLGDGIELERLP